MPFSTQRETRTLAAVAPAEQNRFASMRDPSLDFLPSGTYVGQGPTGFEQEFRQDQFDAAQANKQQMLSLLGLTPQTLGPGGLLGTSFFGSILGQPVGNVAGDISGGLFGGGGASMGGQPGNLFGQLIGSRRAEGADILSDLAGFGDSRRAAINRDFGNLRGTTDAQLESRGLGGTDLVGAAQARVERERQAALGSLEDQLIGQRVGTRMQLGEGLFGNVGDELNRQTERQRIGAQLVGSLLGNVMNVASF